MKFTIGRRALQTVLKAVASRPSEADKISEEDADETAVLAKVDLWVRRDL